jgi:phosphoglycerate dehydrogenase-like enzyme
VFAVEPLPADSPLWAMPNVIISPHVAGMRADYVARLTDILVDNLGRYSRGEPLRNVVDFTRGY